MRLEPHRQPFDTGAGSVPPTLAPCWQAFVIAALLALIAGGNPFTV